MCDMGTKITPATQLAIRLYALLVRLYPRGFRAEFGQEMQAVFADAVAEAVEQGRLPLAVVCLREARDLPPALLREMVSDSRDRRKEALMSETVQNQSRAKDTGPLPQDSPASWPAALVGTALFLLLGLDLILGEIPHHWPVPAWLPLLRGRLFLSTLALPAIGLGVGWVKGFPRWSYPYTGYVLLSSLYTMSVATPGLRILGYTFGPNDYWGSRAWIPFFAMAVVALLITRSLRPLLKLFTNAGKDWTLLTFGMFGFMPLLVAFGFDEVDRLYSLYFMVALTLVMAGTALAYLRSARLEQRALALFAGITLVVAVVTVAPAIYWLEHGWANLTGGVIGGAIVVVIMSFPLLASLLCRSGRPLEAA
jgi:hypothetical protein